MQARGAGGKGWDDLKGTHKSAGEGRVASESERVGPWFG